jgi:hypothetical protein
MERLVPNVFHATHRCHSKHGIKHEVNFSSAITLLCSLRYETYMNIYVCMYIYMCKTYIYMYI